MNNYREIVTKAILAKAKKTTQDKDVIIPNDKPDTVLGCWIINHNFNGINKNGEVLVNGSYDVNVWYSFDNDSKTNVVTKTVNYTDIMNINIKNDYKLDNTSEIILEALKQPTVSNVNIEDNKINISISKEIGAQIVGNTKVRVPAVDVSNDYEELTSETILDDIKEVDAEYLKDNKLN